MSSTAIIIFREILEIAMILGVVLAATRGLPGRAVWIAGGFAGGILGAGVVALFAQSITRAASGMGQELFNALILFTAAGVIGWTAVWMRSHGRDLVEKLKYTGQQVTQGNLPGFSLSLIIGLALLREGSEIVLFIYSMMLSGQNMASIIMGSIVGLVMGILTGTLLYLGLITISAKYMLKVTGWLLVLLVAGLSSQGAGYLTAAGYFSDFSAPLWDSSQFLSDASGVGKALHSLVGYSARPSAVEAVFYVGTLASLLIIISLMEKKKPSARAAISRA